MNILFLCVANSARSQMAEGLAKSILNSKLHQIESGGSQPSGKVHPTAIQAMDEIDINISNHRSKDFNSLSKDFIKDLDLVVTLCAEEVCPAIFTDAKRLHWPFSDPAGVPEKDRLTAFSRTRDGIREKIMELSSHLGN